MLGSSRLSRGHEAREAKQWRAVLILRRGQAAPGVHSRLLPSPRGPAGAGSEQLPRWWGHGEGGQHRLCFPERSVGAGGAAGVLLPASPGVRAQARHCRHSTKKKSSTTSRTTKRTAMAHHWRRSGRQDTRIRARDLCSSRQRHIQHLEVERGQTTQMAGHRGAGTCPGYQVPRPALLVHPQLCQPPEITPLISSCFVSQVFK